MVKSTSKEVTNRFGWFSAPPPRHSQGIVLHDGYKPNRDAHRGRVRQLWTWQAPLPVRSMLLALMFMRFEAMPSVRKLCRRLRRRRYARDICEFSWERTPDHTTFSRFITRAKPKTSPKNFKGQIHFYFHPLNRIYSKHKKGKFSQSCALTACVNRLPQVVRTVSYRHVPTVCSVLQ